jgi:predicted transcriptional regulator
LQKLNIYIKNTFMSSKKTFSTRIDADRLKALKHLAVDEDKSIGTLLEEAIDDLIKKYEKNKRR